MTKSGSALEWVRTHLLLATTVAALLVHGALVLRYLSPRLVLSGDPPSFGDWPIKFAEASEVAKGGNLPWQTWAYSPAHLAGYPAGVYSGVGTQAYDLFVLGSRGLLPPGTAFDLFLLLIFLLAPLTIVLAGRFCGLNGSDQCLLVIITLLTWHLESHVQYMWSFGTTAFLTGSLLSVAGSMLLMRHVCELSTCAWPHVLMRSLGIGLLGALAFTFHPLTVFLFASLAIIPILYSLGSGALAKAAISGVAVTMTILALNIHWIVPFLGLRDVYVGGVPGPLSTSIRHLIFDSLFDRSYRQPYDTTAGLQLVFALAAVGLWASPSQFPAPFRRQFVAGLAALLLISYGGSYVKFMHQLQPYRFLGAALFVALIPAVAGVRFLAGTLSGWCLELPPGRKMMAWGIVLMAVVLPRFSAPAAQAVTLRPLEGLSAIEKELVAWTIQNTDGSSRLLFTPSGVSLCDRLPFYVPRECIGGPYQDVPNAHRYSNFRGLAGPWFGKDLAELTADDWSARMDLLNVGFVIGYGNDPEMAIIEKVSPNLQREAEFGPIVVFRHSPSASTFFVQGEGRVSASTNSIRLSNLSSGKVVLKYHYLNTLRTEPPIPLSSEHLLGDPVGFIAFDNPGHETLLIYNSYRVGAAGQQTSAIDRPL